MKQVILEYAGTVIAMVGMLCFLLVFHQFFVGPDGVLGQMVILLINEAVR